MVLRSDVIMLHLPLLAVLAVGFAGFANCLPIVDPGLFVILGVRTCGAGDGYCLLGSDCTLDRDFEQDTVGGHCDGLRYAFTPPAHFVCCRYVERSNTTLPGEPGPGEGNEFTTTEDPGAGRDASTSTPPASHLENVIDVEGPDSKHGGGENTTSTAAGGVLVAGPAWNKETEAHVQETSAAGLPPPPDKSNAVDPLSADEQQVLVAMSDVYPVRRPEEENQVNTVVEEPEPDQVLVTPACHNSSSGEVNPCWRTSFVDRSGAVLCSGSMVGVESAITTAVCANRLLSAGVTGVTMRVAETWLHVRDVAVHEGYRPPVEGVPNSAQNDIAVVRLLSVAAEDGPGPGPAPGPSASCLACLPAGGAAAGTHGSTCFALAARFNGLGEESSAVCAGSVVSTVGSLLRLSGCEVASLKSDVMKGQAPAVLAREGAALLCQGVLVGLASTSVGSYLSLAPHRAWLSRTLSATRTVTDHFFRV